jgi:SAM-dependent methyltransferase
LDERVVEYPWVLARCTPGRTRRVLDAGSTFSTPLILDLPQVADWRVLIYTLATDWIGRRDRVSYVWGDLRAMAMRDGVFDTVVCISTLEHVGMAQTFDYSSKRPYPVAERFAYRDALREMCRVVAPRGRLLLTVPFGLREDHGWLQQFDSDGIRDIVATFDGDLLGETYYRYDGDGWQLSSAAECATERYYNIHADPAIPADGAAAARAVCCLELSRT